MLIQKTWERKKYYKGVLGAVKHHYIYTGWFLFGILPVYIKRTTIR